jgi:23S rRNA pseudouridine2605 synthase
VERWITEGRVSVDGHRAQLGDRLSGAERVFVDGRPVKLRAIVVRRHSFRAYYKPAGEAAARRDPEARPTLFAHIKPPRRGRWLAVGLEVGASGLVLLTTDGDLVARLARARDIQSEYAVRLAGQISPNQTASLSQGVAVEGRRVSLADIAPIGGAGRNAWYRVTAQDVTGGEIRRAFESVGMEVGRIIRVRFGPVALGDLHRGQSRPLRPHEVAALCEAVDR